MKKTAILVLALLGAFLSGCQDHILEPPPGTTPQAVGAWRIGGANNDTPNHFTRDLQGNLFITANQSVAKYNSLGQLQWLKSLPNPLIPSAYNISADGGGNVYITGAGLGSRADFGQSGEGWVYLISYNPDGALRWILSSSTDGTSNNGTMTPLGITSDGSGNTYIAGTFSFRVDFGGIELLSRPSNVRLGFNEDAFLLKVNKDGALQWVKSLGGTRGDILFDVALDQSGNIYASGSTNSSVNSSFPGINTQVETSFAVKYTPDGTQQWITAVREASLGIGRSIGVDAAGNSYVRTGYVITKLSSQGEQLWHRGIPDPGPSPTLTPTENIAVNANGDYYIFGEFSGTLTIEGQTLTSVGGTDIYIAKYDTNGSLQWAIRDGGPQDERVREIRLVGGGVFHLLGTFVGTTNLAGTTLTSAGGTDIFVATYQQ